MRMTKGGCGNGWPWVMHTQKRVRDQELCESRGGRPEFLSLIIKPTVSADVKQQCT